MHCHYNVGKTIKHINIVAYWHPCYFRFALCILSSYQWMRWCNRRSWRSGRKRWGRRDISVAANIVITIVAIITVATVVCLVMLLMCWSLHGQVFGSFCQWWCWWLSEILCPTLVPWSSPGSCLDIYHNMLYAGLSFFGNRGQLLESHWWSNQVILKVKLWRVVSLKKSKITGNKHSWMTYGGNI